MNLVNPATHIRHRREDGLPAIVPSGEHLARAERTLAMFTVALFAHGLFLCAAIPFQLLVLILAGWAAGELALAFRALLALRRPRAEVREFVRYLPR
jgi:hypothetical protein